MKFTLYGPPIPQPRPRFRRCGAFVTTYTPNQKIKNKTKIELKNQIDEYIKDSSKEIYSIEQSFKVKFIFYLPIPKKDSIYEKNLKLWGLNFPNIKPDFDNLEKFYLDCANKILWKDDCQIIESSSLKKYSDNPRTEIIVTPIKKIMNESENFKKFIKNFSPDELNNFIEEIKTLSKIESDNIDFNEDIEKIINFANKFHVKLKRIVNND